MQYCIWVIWLNRSRAGLLLVLAGAAFSISAQSSGQGGIPNTRVTGPFGDSIERRSRETGLRSLTVAPADRGSANTVSPAVLAGLNEDFKEIQIIRLGLIRILQDGKSFEYKRLREDAAEINKRARRIQTFLAIGEKHGEDAGKFVNGRIDRAAMHEAVAELCLEISSFTVNPIFNSKRVYAARDAARAWQTLDLVINLSANIKNGAEELRSVK